MEYLNIDSHGGTERPLDSKQERALKYRLSSSSSLWTI